MLQNAEFSRLTHEPSEHYRSTCGNKLKHARIWALQGPASAHRFPDPAEAAAIGLQLKASRWLHAKERFLRQCNKPQEERSHNLKFAAYNMQRGEEA